LQDYYFSAMENAGPDPNVASDDAAGGGAPDALDTVRKGDG
jgi:hypothetical protein